MKHSFLRVGSAAILVFFLVGCTVGPNYHRPNVATAPAWKEQAPWRAADPKDAVAKGDWWATFSDNELIQYEAQGPQSQPDH